MATPNEHDQSKDQSLSGELAASKRMKRKRCDGMDEGVGDIGRDDRRSPSPVQRTQTYGRISASGYARVHNGNMIVYGISISLRHLHEQYADRG